MTNILRLGTWTRSASMRKEMRTSLSGLPFQSFPRFWTRWAWIFLGPFWSKLYFECWIQQKPNNKLLHHLEKKKCLFEDAQCSLFVGTVLCSVKLSLVSSKLISIEKSGWNLIQQRSVTLTSTHPCQNTCNAIVSLEDPLNTFSEPYRQNELSSKIDICNAKELSKSYSSIDKSEILSCSSQYASIWKIALHIFQKSIQTWSEH